MSANERQEGGDHYKQGDKKLPEHWDLVIAYEWDYFQSQITKYLMRWKKKGTTLEKKIEDLKKSRHFLDKYIENAEVYLQQSQELKGPALHVANVETLLAAYEVKSTTFLSDAQFLAEGGYGDMQNLYTCRRCGAKVMAPSLEAAAALHPHLPPTGAV